MEFLYSQNIFKSSISLNLIPETSKILKLSVSFNFLTKLVSFFNSICKLTKMIPQLVIGSGQFLYKCVSLPQLAQKHSFLKKLLFILVSNLLLYIYRYFFK